MSDTLAADQPARYCSGGIECIEAIRAALTPEEFRGYCKGCVIKYAWREGDKGGDTDLGKAIDYLNFAIAASKCPDKPIREGMKDQTQDRKNSILAFLFLEKNWDGHGARKISRKAVHLALDILPYIPSDYSVFPTKTAGVGFQSRSDRSPFLFLQIDHAGHLYSYLRESDGSCTEKKDDTFSNETIAKYVRQTEQSQRVEKLF